MRVTSSRLLALNVMRRVRRDGAWLAAVLPRAIEKASLDRADAAFATRLLNGAVAFRGTLDELIDAAADHPSKIEPRVRDALRLATYELLFMDTPSRAAVDQGVEMVRSVSTRAAGFSNAVLRRIDADREHFPFGDPARDIEAMARETGHPTWMAELMVSRFGRDAATAILRADNEPAPLYVALNPFRGEYGALVQELAAAGAEPVELPRFVAGSVECRNASAAVNALAIREGRAVVADLAAQAIVAALPDEAFSTIVETAAGRGTKTVLLQAHFSRDGHVPMLYASDLREAKVQALQERITFLHVPDVRTRVADATDADALRVAGAEPDLVFVDAPCSGLGTLRRHPEKRWDLRRESLDELASLGRAMLEAAGRIVRPGGFVVYSTCTITREENDDIVSEFLERESERFTLVDLRDRMPKGMAEFVGESGCFQSLPTLDGPDGHFAALVRRTR